MSQYNFDRTGANLSEQVLNTSNVNSASFGKLFTRTVDDSVYALPLIIPNLTIAGGVHDVMFVATMDNSVYAFDAADAGLTRPYWSVNLGTPGIGDSWIGPINVGILSTPFIDEATKTMYVVAEVRNGTDVGLYIHALDITTGQLKYNSPRRMSFGFPTEGVTLTSVNGGIQRAGLLVSNGVLYVAVANILPGDHNSQEGFVQSFDAQNLTNQLGTFQATPSAPEGKGGIGEAGRGLPVDASGVYFSVAGGAYSATATPPNFGSSIVKVAPSTLSVQDWFAPQNWQYLFDNNVDPAAGGVTLIPGSQLLFAGGKEGVIYLLNRNSMGHLEGTDGQPVQRFQAGYGCAQNTTAPDCSQSLGTAYWDRGGDGMLYVWDKTGVLRAYHFNGQTFDTSSPQVGTSNVGMTGGPSLSASGADPSSAIVWAVTTSNVDSGTPSPGTLRAFRADDITQELYDSDINQAADRLGTMTKFAPPVVANGKVYVATQSNAVQAYGLLPSNQGTTGAAGTIPVTVQTSPVGRSFSVDGTSYTGIQILNWVPGSTHTIATTATQSGGSGTQYVWNTWSDAGALSHTVTPSSATTYTAAFSLTNNATLTAGYLSGSGDSAITAVNLTAEGGADWVHWGDASLSRKAGGNSQIGNYSIVGGGSALLYSNDLRPVGWSDGTPTASSSNNRNGFYVVGPGKGFSFTAPAGTVSRTLKVHVGGWNSGGMLIAHLSDGSAPDFVDVAPTSGGQYDRNYTLTYQAASAGQTLTVTWKMNSGSSLGNVTLNAAALAGASSIAATPGSVQATGGTSQSAMVNTLFATALQATVKDATGNPMSGVNVNFILRSAQRSILLRIRSPAKA
jgi:hypothetical protein